jgi:F-type H+-transporting ATPase subunit gamma
MAKTREIKKRIKAVGNIRRITKTMQMIATAKFAASEQRAKAGKPYTETIFSLVRDLAGSIEDASHPLLDAGGKGAGASDQAAATGKKELTLIITSDRGLCGPYNGSVLRAAMAFFKSNPGAKDGLVELVGKKGAGFLKFVGVPISKQHAFGDKPSYEQVRSLVEGYIARFTAGELASVRVVYMKYFSAGKQAPTILQLLPFKADAASGKPGAVAAPAKAATPYEFSPDANSLLNDLLPAAVKAVLFQAFSDAIVSEHVSRMIAMKAATDNAGKMGKLYSRKFNRARQAQITTELTEIISGAAALE